MKTITNILARAISVVMGLKKSDGGGQEVEDKQVKRANEELSFKMKT